MYRCTITMNGVRFPLVPWRTAWSVPVGASNAACGSVEVAKEVDMCAMPGSELIKRIMDEERLLGNELAGYDEYMKKVKSRLIPMVW